MSHRFGGLCRYNYTTVLFLASQTIINAFDLTIWSVAILGCLIVTWMFPRNTVLKAWFYLRSGIWRILEGCWGKNDLMAWKCVWAGTRGLGPDIRYDTPRTSSSRFFYVQSLKYLEEIWSRKVYYITQHFMEVEFKRIEKQLGLSSRWKVIIY